MFTQFKVYSRKKRDRIEDSLRLNSTSTLAYTAYASIILNINSKYLRTRICAYDCTTCVNEQVNQMNYYWTMRYVPQIYAAKIT